MPASIFIRVVFPQPEGPTIAKILPFDIVVASFATVLMPYIMKYVSGGEFKQAAALLKNYYRVGFYTVWCFGTAVLIVHKQAISFLYSDAFLSEKEVFIIYHVFSAIKKPLYISELQQKIILLDTD